MFEKYSYKELTQQVQKLKRKIARYEQTAENHRFIDIRHALIEYAAAHTLEELLIRSLDEVGACVDSPIGFYHFVEPDQQTLSLQQWSTRTLKEFCKAEGKGLHYSIDQAGVWVDCVYTKKPVVHNDYASLPHKRGMPEGHAEVIRELVVPVIREDKVVAILGVGNKPTKYTQKDTEVVSYLADVTWEIVRQKRVEEALLNEKLRSEEYINSLPGLFYVFDEQAQLVRWNGRVNVVTGYSDAELEGKYAGDFFKGEDVLWIQEEMNKAFKEGAGEAEALLVTKEGQCIPYYFTGLLKKLDGKDHLIGLGIDITEPKRVEAERQRFYEHLQQAYKMEAIGALAGGVAHKLNNYLSGVSGNIELLKMALPEDKKINKYTERMLKSVANMANLSNQLLAYAEGGKYQPQALSFNDFIENTLSIVLHKLPPDTHIETDIPAGISNIEGDQTQIQMLLSAVLENAAEAIGKDGRIKIVARNEEIKEDVKNKHLALKAGAYICLKVIDNGRGMDEDTKRRIFEPFFTTNFQGRGLGMAAVYGIIKNHNGRIDVESEPGKGTVVSIYLPAMKVRLKERTAPRTEIYKGVGTILLIEDEEMAMEVGKAMIENMGYHVLTAKNGKEAIHIAQTFDGNIDLALMDVVLPDIGGKELYLQLMKVRPELKVIVCSGYSIDGPAREILEAGAQAFIQKPFLFGELSLKLNQMTDRRKHKRIKSTGNAVVALRSNNSRQGQLIDVSKGGLAFCYAESSFRSLPVNVTDSLTINLTDFLIDNIPCKIISDFILTDDVSSDAKIMRRCSIQFGQLTSSQKDKLACLTEENHEQETDHFF